MDNENEKPGDKKSAECGQQEKTGFLQVFLFVLGLAFAITNYFYGEKSVYDCVKRSAIYGRV